MKVVLLFLAEPPLEIFASLFPPLILFGLEAGPQLLPQLDQFLMGKRKAATLADVAFRGWSIRQLATAFGTVPHRFRLFPGFRYAI
jgi:hypothetical protein